MYYSAFSPIPHADPRLPAARPPLVREHRLYQADWLLRFYGFEAHELVADADRNLSLEMDPKLAWALAHRGYFPVDVNKASREELLRIPGVGVRNVERMLAQRGQRRLAIADLKKMRVAWSRAAPFVIAADANPAAAGLDRAALPGKVKTRNRQLLLFEAADGAGSGEF